MTALPTAALAGAALLLTVLCGWRGAVRAKALASPRLIPWRALMLICFLAMVLLLGHLVALYRND